VLTVEAPAFTQERLLGLLTAAPNAFHRRDVDVSLSAAVKMARFDEVAGISATYYLNPRCDFHNIFSREGRAARKAILDCGHRIGLHCDFRTGSVIETVDRDLALMGADGPLDSDAVSFHMPPASVLWRDFEHFDNAYASKWEGRYLSDSRREFGPEKGVRVALEGDSLQINLHPEHWFPSA
jgi:hypothetical protein